MWRSSGDNVEGTVVRWFVYMPLVMCVQCATAVAAPASCSVAGEPSPTFPSPAQRAQLWIHLVGDVGRAAA